jgi:hypothetical protein
VLFERAARRVALALDVDLGDPGLDDDVQVAASELRLAIMR